MSQYSYKKEVLILFFSSVDKIFNLIPRKKIIYEEKYQKILVANLGHLGDILLTLPFLDVLRKNFPNSQIDILMGPAGAVVLEDNRTINNKFIYTAFHDRHGQKRGGYPKYFWALSLFKKLRERRYDLFFDLKGDPVLILLGFLIKARRRVGYSTGGLGRLLTDEVELNPNQHQIFINLDLLRPLNILTADKDIKLSIPIQSEFLSQAENFLREKNIAPQDFLIILHPGSGYQSKIWPVEHWRKLVNQLSKDSQIKMVIIGVSQELSMIKEILDNTKGVISAIDFEFSFLVSLFFKARLFIGSDSGPAHLAAALNIPIISIFSAANKPIRWQPYTPKLTLFYRDVPCVNCEKKNCQNKICLKNIKPIEVCRAIQSLWLNTSQTEINENYER